MDAGSAPNRPGGFARRLLARALPGLSGSRLAQDSLVVFWYSGLGRGVSLLKELLVAYLFGVSGHLDAYFLGLLIPMLLVNILGASFTAALIPEVGRTLAAGDEAGARRTVSSSLALLAALLGLTALLLAVLPAKVLQALAPLAETERLAQIKTLQMELLPVLLLGGLNNALAALANLRGAFRGPALASMANTVAMAAVMATCFRSLGLQSLPAGMDAGFALESAALVLLMRRVWGGGVFRGWRGLRPGMPAMLRHYAAMALGSVVMALTSFVDNAIASTAAAGSVSALNYAHKIPSALSALGLAVIGTVLLPHFSQSVYRLSPEEFWGGVKRVLRVLLWIVTPVAAAGALFSRPLAALVFQRGGFDVRATDLVAGAQVFYLLQLPLYLSGLALGRALQAMGRHSALLLISATLLPFYAAADFVLARLYGVSGIAAASALMYLASTLLLFVIARRAALRRKS